MLEYGLGMKLLWIGLFGIAGVFARYASGLAIGRALPSSFPYATLVINVTGAFAIGVTYVLGFERAAIPAEVRVGLMVGFLGGFTTFSSYSLEVARLLEEAEYAYASLYFGLSNAAGFAATFLGLVLTRLLIRGEP